MARSDTLNLRGFEDGGSYRFCGQPNSGSEITRAIPKNSVAERRVGQPRTSRRMLKQFVQQGRNERRCEAYASGR